MPSLSFVWALSFLIAAKPSSARVLCSSMLASCDWLQVTFATSVWPWTAKAYVQLCIENCSVHFCWNTFVLFLLTPFFVQVVHPANIQQRRQVLSTRISGSGVMRLFRRKRTNMLTYGGGADMSELFSVIFSADHEERNKKCLRLWPIELHSRTALDIALS